MSENDIKVIRRLITEGVITEQELRACQLLMPCSRCAFGQADFTEFEGGDLTRGKEDYPKGLTDDMGFIVGLISYGDKL